MLFILLGRLTTVISIIGNVAPKGCMVAWSPTSDSYMARKERSSKIFICKLLLWKDFGNLILAFIEIFSSLISFISGSRICSLLLWISNVLPTRPFVTRQLCWLGCLLYLKIAAWLGCTIGRSIVIKTALSISSVSFIFTK